MNANYPNNLRKERDRLEWSQDTLAKVMNTTRSHISHWETGEQVPPLEAALRLAKIFHVSVEYLFPISFIRSDNRESVKVDITELNDSNREIVLTLIAMLRRSQSKDED